MFARPFKTHLAFILTISCLTNVEAQSIDFERIQLSDEFYSEGACVGDFNKDGHGDVAVGPWIYLGPDFSSKTQFYEAGAVDPIGYSENFLMFSSDVNNDGRLDIIVAGWPGKKAWWYENTAGGFSKLWKEHVILEGVDNESPNVADIDGDGTDDLICSYKGQYGFCSYAGQDATKPWKFIPVSPNKGYGRYTHGLGVGDIDDDGRNDLVEKDGWWQQPAKIDPTKTWKFHPFEFSKPGGSQMLVMDVDGEAGNEVVTSLFAHGPGLSYFKQGEKGFIEVPVMTGDVATSPCGLAVTQLHALASGDINGDGVLDLISGKRWWAHGNKDPGNDQPATLFWLETKRDSGRVKFIPHVIDISSGVGTQVTVADVNGDQLLDIVCGIKRGAYVFLQRPQGLEQGQSLVSSYADRDPFDQKPALDEIALKGGSDAYLPATGNRPLNFDFASDLKDWEIRGTIRSSYQLESGIFSSGAIGTDPKKKQRQIGELISRPFKLLRPKLSFAIGGDPDPALKVEVVLESSGTVICSATPQGSELSRREFEVGDWHGELVRVRVVDHADNRALRFGQFEMLAK